MSLRCLRIINAVHTLNRNIYSLKLEPKITFRIINNRSLCKMSGEQAVFGAAEGLKLKEVVDKLSRFADERLAEKWDNVGLLIEPYEVTVQNIMLTNDLTENVLEEALEKNINLIISYHPPIFKPLKRITQETWKERIIATCFENKIAVYSPHTAWDSVYGGVTDWLADAFKEYFEEDEDYQPHSLIPQTDEELDPRSGSGRLIYVNDISTELCVELIKAHTGLKNVRIALGKDRTLESCVKVIAVVCGSGGSLLKDTIANLFVTGEMSHHELLEANHNGISVILTNHSDSERGFLKIMRNNLEKMFGTKVNITVSECDRDPLVTV